MKFKTRFKILSIFCYSVIIASVLFHFFIGGILQAICWVLGLSIIIHLESSKESK